MLIGLADTYRRQKTLRVHRAAALGEMLDMGARHSFARLTDRELALGTKCKRHCDESRRFAAEGNAYEACGSAGTARAIAQSAALSEEARLLCRAEIAPAEAYMERIFNNLTTARELINQSLYLDQDLEERFGHHIKVAHRVHMLIVSAALLFQQREAMAASLELAAILKYLAGLAKAPAGSGNWGQFALSRLPAGMRDVLALQAVEFLYGGLTVSRGVPRKAVVDAFLARLGHGARKVLAKPTNPNHGVAGDYLSLLEASSTEECTYLLHSTRLLERTQVRSLIYSITLDCACCCIERGVSVEFAVVLAREIRRDARGQILPFPLHGAVDATASSAASRHQADVSA